jgi:GT2 family glycosyltransferase
LHYDAYEFKYRFGKLNTPEVSLIIPTYNREQVLCNTIRYALKQDFGNYEILVIDQTEKHSPETSLFLESLPAKVRIINFFPASLPGARNRGILEARGEIVLMIDDDVIINKDFINQHARYYRHPDVAGVTGRIFVKSEKITKTPFFIRNEFIQWIGTQNFTGVKTGYAYRVIGCNFSFRKDCAAQINLFDTNFIGTAWGEEYDFSLRLRKKGHKIIYNPEASMYHLNVSDGGCENRARFNRNSIYSRAHNLTYLVEKNRLNRLLYLYLVWYVYKRSFFKKNYVSFSGFLFIAKAQICFFRGLIDGYIKGKQIRE